MSAHWPLTQPEQAILGKTTQDLLKSLPKSTNAKVAKALGRWLPWVGFAMTVNIILTPRIAQSMALRRPNTAPAQPDATGAPAGMGPVRTWADLDPRTREN